MAKDIAKDSPIANPGDYPEDRVGDETLFRMWAGAYGDTIVYVWADNLEDAFEEFVEWLDENAPGLLTTIDESDYKSAAKDLKVQWQRHWPDFDDKAFQKVAEAAEADMTAIGHTTLEHGTHIASWEWGGEEVHPAGPEYLTVLERSEEEADDDEDDED